MMASVLQPPLPPKLLQRLIMQSREMLRAFLGCSFSRGFSAGKETKFCQGKVQETTTVRDPTCSD